MEDLHKGIAIGLGVAVVLFLVASFFGYAKLGKCDVLACTEVKCPEVICPTLPAFECPAVKFPACPSLSCPGQVIKPDLVKAGFRARGLEPLLPDRLRPF